ncbi:mannitol dehydrogenase family protein [Billgrantia bachuensis]|uniref:Mannitol dehydrogenase family protein n=1 Tax=Billgrantia bachuensis TaxID=2717286 RepID=A0ABX0PZB9_9GAMM|nr:mannitol dehydrogenase family protein [Halomonas bachuensis]NIC07508.1 mannitol dehydrogenase family protein [Halomonas bachuensis]
MPALSNATLTRLDPRIAVPRYDRQALTPGIVHIGVGGFHRAHQAMYLDELMNRGQAFDWGIVGVGVMPGDRRMQEALSAQDHLYTLVVKHPGGEREPRVIGAMLDYLFAPDDPEAAIECMADPAIRIVSLTVTEGGYNFHPVSGEFDLGNPDVRHDLDRPDAPRTTFGLVVEALARRRERGLTPFTIMSCDNIQGNGEVARRMFSAFARARDTELGEWLEFEVPFPNAMVDRITPVTQPADIEELAHEFGVDDAWPVVCEPFTQWVLEDRFVCGRPPLEQAGVQVVEDVEPYELMKLRLLNASHQALCYFGYLAGYRYAHEVCRDPLFVDFLLGYMRHEGSPTLAPVPGVDLEQYRLTLIERFANPEIKDTLARLCAESSDRIPKWLVPVIREQLARGGEIHRSAAVVASWARYAEGTDEQGEPITVVDRFKNELMALAAVNRTQPTAFIDNRELFGDLAEHERFRQAYLAALESLHERGARATLEALSGEQAQGAE